jgi:hypothetical protein
MKGYKAISELMCLGLREGPGYTKARIFVYSLYINDGLFVGLREDDKSPGYVQTVYGEERWRETNLSNV